MKWTPEEIEYARTHIPRHGIKRVAVALGKSEAAVRKWAQRNDVQWGDLKGWLTVTEVAARAGVTKAAAHGCAERAGVTRHLYAVPKRQATPRQVLVLIRESWALDYIATQREKHEGTDARSAGFLSTGECAELWGVSASTVQRALNGVGALAPFLEGARVVLGRGETGRPALYMNPHDAEDVRSRLQAERNLARSMVSVKALSAEWGLPRQTIRKKALEVGGGRVLFTSNYRRLYLTPEQAEEVGRRLGVPEVRRAA